MTCQSLGLCAPALAALKEQGCAQTGTGKTCAFAAPILQRLIAARTPDHRLRALILTPTRELAIQIGESFAAYGAHLSLRHTVIFGGVGQNPQVEALGRGVDILVATPGRLMDLYQQGFVRLEELEIFVLDEADRMLDMGFIHDVKKILKWLPAKKQTMLFSATMPPEIAALVNSLLHDPARVAVDPVSSPVEAIRQSVYFVDKGNKTKLLALLIEQLDVKNALVFTRTKHGANKVAQDLNKAGLTAAAIHGNKSQSARQQALADFKSGKVRILVATDIAARGIDIEELPYVFNYNLPEVPETYVHRIGRTGRAGHEGAAIAFCDFGEQEYLRGIEKLIGRSLPVKESQWPMEVLEAPVKETRGRQPRQGKAQTSGRQGKKAAAPKGEQARQAAPKAEEPKKKKFGPRTKTLAEFEAEERAFQERLKQEKKERSPIHQAGALAGDVIMDATARLLAPRKAAKPAREEKATRQGKRKPQPQKQEGKKGEAGKKADLSGKAQGKAPAKSRGGRPRRDRGPRPVELRPSHIKDSTQQPSLMKPFYIGQDD